jgi:polyhydroxyalkanoate synthesis regulator phasin
MSKQVKRGRKQEKFSSLSKEFLKKGKLIRCKPKPFADDISKMFIRKLSKNSGFCKELDDLLRELRKFQNFRKSSSNRKAKTIIDALASRQDLLQKIKNRFLIQDNWKDQLESYLKICYSGTRSKDLALKELIDEIFRYIGLDEKIETFQVFQDSSGLEWFTAESSETGKPLMDLEEVFVGFADETAGHVTSFKSTFETIDIDEVLKNLID